MKVDARRFLLIGSIALLAVVAVLGWTRKTSEPGAYTVPAPNGYYTSVGNPGVGSPGVGDPGVTYPGSDNPEPAMEPPPPDACAAPVTSAVYGSAFDTPRYVHVVRPAPPPEPEQYADRVAPAPTRRYVVERHRRGRSKAKSVAIVAGTAGVGAAMGAIAGGGKGAALGALAGGGAGFVYDRLTHNR